LEPPHINLEAEPSTIVFRVFQEALTNTARHANASNVHIQLYKNEKQVYLVIIDNGEGITQKQVYNENSMGILGMQERARLWGGEVHISGVSGKGTTVKLRMPFTKK
jgi:signal transduction histidine kinase